MYKTIYLIISAFLSFTIAYTLALLPINPEHQCATAIALAIIILTINAAAIHLGSTADNKKLLTSLRKETTTRVTHRGRSRVINEKLHSGMLTPFGVVADSPAQRLLGNYILELIDGKEKVTWISLGYPSDSKNWQLGALNNSRWDMAISFYIATEKISTPKSFFKKIFGRHQLILKETVVLNGEEDIYVRDGSQWLIKNLGSA